MAKDSNVAAEETQGFFTDSWDKVKQSFSDLGEGISNFGQQLGRNLQGEGIHVNFEKVQDALGESWTTVHDSFKPIKRVGEESVTSLHHFAIEELPRSVTDTNDFMFKGGTPFAERPKKSKKRSRVTKRV